MYKLLLITFIGYLVGAAGLFIGTVMSLTIGGHGSRLQKVFMGSTGGMLVSFVCFHILENAFNIAGVYVSVVGISVGVFLSVFTEVRANRFSKITSKSKNKYYRAAVVMCIAIIIHSLVEGIAVGSFLQHSLKSGIALAIILAIHCIPEGVTLSAYLKRGDVSDHKIIIVSLVLAISMGVGSLLGGAINNFSPKIISTCLSFAGGVMLYVACGQIIPESKDKNGNLLSYIFAIIGFIIGLIIIKFL